jgi:hypothetical protein
MDRSDQAVDEDRMMSGLLQEIVSRKALCRLIKLLYNQTWLFCWRFPFAVLTSYSCRELSALVVFVVSFSRAMLLSSLLYRSYKLSVCNCISVVHSMEMGKIPRFKKYIV